MVKPEFVNVKNSTKTMNHAMALFEMKCMYLPSRCNESLIKACVNYTCMDNVNQAGPFSSYNARSGQKIKNKKKETPKPKQTGVYGCLHVAIIKCNFTHSCNSLPGGRSRPSRSIVCG